MERTGSMAATECAIHDATEPVKLLTLGLRRDGLARDLFDRAYAMFVRSRRPAQEIVFFDVGYPIDCASRECRNSTPTGA